MKVQFLIVALEQAWSLRRGPKPIREFETKESAIAEVERLVPVITARGDRAEVKVVAGGQVLEQRSFAPDIF